MRFSEQTFRKFDRANRISQKRDVASVFAADKTPDQAKRDQRENRVAAAHVPHHPFAADFAGRR